MYFSKYCSKSSGWFQTFDFGSSNCFHVLPPEEGSTIRRIEVVPFKKLEDRGDASNKHVDSNQNKHELKHV